MSTKEVEGIVIKEVNYNESSKILTVLTKELGLISIMSKASRTMKSKLRAVSSKLTYGKFYIHYKENSISTLKNVDVYDYFKNIRGDIFKISYASFLLDLSYQLTKEEFNPEVYEILITALKKIEEGLDPEIISSIVEIKALDFLGVRPNIDECNICGRKTDIVTVSGNSGGYICKHCHTNEKIVSTKTIQILRMFFYVELEKVTKLSIGQQTRQELTEFIDEYYERYTGLYLKSKKFLQDLRKYN